MKEKKKIVNITMMLILVMICSVSICMAMFDGARVVKADDGKDIIPYTREVGSGTRAAFIKMTGLEQHNWLGEMEDTTAEDVAVVESSQEVLTQISNTKDGLGYVSYAVEKDSDLVKEVTVEGIKPTIANIRNGSYSLTRDLQLVYHKQMTDIEKDFLQYIKSEGQGYISDYCVPAREKGIYLPNGAKGDLVISGSTSMTPMMEVLAQKYMEVNSDATVEVKASDSEGGMMDVLEGSSNFGMVSRDLKSYEETMLTSERIGRDAIAIVVNPENDLEDISISQLKKIYNGSIYSWEYLKVYE